jgi:hypothetical protein
MNNNLRYTRPMTKSRLATKRPRVDTTVGPRRRAAR